MECQLSVPTATGRNFGCGGVIDCICATMRRAFGNCCGAFRASQDEKAKGAEKEEARGCKRDYGDYERGGSTASFRPSVLGRFAKHSQAHAEK